LDNVLQRPPDDLYYPTRPREDRSTPPYKLSPESYAYLTPDSYKHASPAPPYYCSSSPEERGQPSSPERGLGLRVVQYDPKRFDPDRPPPQRVYRGGYPVASKAIGMTEPTYTMPDGRIWTVNDDEPPPRPESPPRQNGSKRHNQYSEAEDWFLVHYSNWLMKKEPKIEMKDLYARVHVEMKNHTPLALYLRVNKSKDYFRRLGMDERALSRRIQMPSGRKNREWDDDIIALEGMSIRDRP